MIEDKIIKYFKLYNKYPRDVVDNVLKELYKKLLVRWNFAYHKVEELSKIF